MLGQMLREGFWLFYSFRLQHSKFTIQHFFGVQVSASLSKCGRLNFEV